MHFLILGGNGRTGSLVVELALSRGHAVTALVRNPDNFPLSQQEGLTLVQGSPMTPEDMDKAFKARPIDRKEAQADREQRPPAAAQEPTSNEPHDTASKPILDVFQKPDVVLVTLNAPRQSDNPLSKSIAPPRLMTTSITNALQTMEVHQVPGIVIMQAFGVGSSYNNNNFLMRLILSKTEMSKQFDDHNAVDAAVRAVSPDGSVSWTMLRPAMLAGEGTKAVRVLGDEGEDAGWFPSISRESVARFMVVECAEEGKWGMRTPVICN
ncbi:MAG: hypothetical protein Q9162_002135 [Coniocarpon cinnabarinum]